MPPIIERGAEWFSRHRRRRRARARSSTASAATSSGPASTRRRWARRCASSSTTHRRRHAATASSSRRSFPAARRCRCSRADEIDVAMDFDSVAKAGSLLGSCGIIVMDEATCMVRALHDHRALLPPRVVRPVHAVPRGHRLARGPAASARVRRRRARRTSTCCCRVADNMIGNTICVLADAAAMPVQSFLTKFRAEFERPRRAPAAARCARRARPTGGGRRSRLRNAMPKLEIDGQTIDGRRRHEPDPGGRARRHRDPALLLPPRSHRSPATAACAWSRSRRCPSCRSPATRRVAEGMVVQHRERAR